MTVPVAMCRCCTVRLIGQLVSFTPGWVSSGYTGKSANQSTSQGWIVGRCTCALHTFCAHVLTKVCLKRTGHLAYTRLHNNRQSNAGHGMP
jgi:hypothetical protein